MEHDKQDWGMLEVDEDIQSSSYRDHVQAFTYAHASTKAKAGTDVAFDGFWLFREMQGDFPSMASPQLSNLWW